jgi:hypothetical protein
MEQGDDTAVLCCAISAVINIRNTLLGGIRKCRFGMVFSISLLALLLASGCSKPVLKQDIPVTTNPLGAKILANGQPMGQTPSSVSLERNRDHILTLLKDGYRQEDVVVKRKYQSEKFF